MEPITQGLLGAAVAQAACAPRLGRRALLWGALIGMTPDLDVLVAPLHNGFGELLYHRGTTHALWFGFAVGPPIGWALWRWRDGPGRPETLRAWIALAVLALVTHPLLDGFTTYGTQLFAPFWRHRFAWNGVGIIDPSYTALLAVGVVWGIRRGVPPERRRRAALIALALSSAYLGGGYLLNRHTEQVVAEQLAERGHGRTDVRAYPTVFQPFLRRFVARGPDTIHVGLYTPFASDGPYVQSFPAPLENALVRDLRATWEGALLEWFALEQITWRVRRTPRGTVVTLEDLRYALPGTPPDQGMWGVHAVYDLSGKRATPVRRFNRRGGRSLRPASSALWAATWGDFSLMTKLGQGSTAPP